jgi:hypothetical protein
MAKLFSVGMMKNSYTNERVTVDIVAPTFMAALKRAQQYVRRNHPYGRVVSIDEERDNIVVAQ